MGYKTKLAIWILFVLGCAVVIDYFVDFSEPCNCQCEYTVDIHSNPRKICK